MTNLWLKIKIWTKFILFALLALYILVFILSNRTEEVSMWVWFGHSPKHSVLWYTFFAFVSGVIGTILTRTTLSTLSQIREVRSRGRQDKLEREISDMKAKAAMLQTKTSGEQGAP